MNRILRHTRSWSSMMLAAMFYVLLISSGILRPGQEHDSMCTGTSCHCDMSNGTCTCMLNGHHQHGKDGSGVEHHVCGCSFPDQPVDFTDVRIFDKAFVSLDIFVLTWVPQRRKMVRKIHYSHVDTDDVFHPPQQVV